MSHTSKRTEHFKNLIFPGIAFICFCLFSSCSKHIPSVFEVVSMRLSNSENTGENPVDVFTDSVSKNAYAIKLTLEEVLRKKTEGDAQENGFVNEDQLNFLNVSSLNNFDTDHPAGSSLNAYFLTELNSSSSIASFISKGQFGEGKYKDGNYTDSWSSEQYLYLMKAPTASNNQSFIVDVGFSDGRTLKDTITVNLY